MEGKAEKQNDIEMNHKGSKEERILNEMELILAKMKKIHSENNDAEL